MIRVRSRGFFQRKYVISIEGGSNAALYKWAEGNASIDYFKTRGNIFINSFCVKESGVYTVFTFAGNRETLQTVSIRKAVLLPYFILAACFLALAITAMAIGLSMSNRIKPSKRPTVITGALNGSAPSKSEQELLEALKKKQITVTDKVSTSAVFPIGNKGTEGTWSIDNLKTNNVVMQAEIHLNGRIISMSPQLRPGQYSAKLKLSNTIPSGQYRATAYIDYYDLKTLDYISRAGYEIIVQVG